MTVVIYVCMYVRLYLFIFIMSLALSNKTLPFIFFINIKDFFFFLQSHLDFTFLWLIRLS